MGAKEELLSAGYKSYGLKPCPKCQQEVEEMESPAGGKIFFNTDSHPTASGCLHMWTCGSDERQQ